MVASTNENKLHKIFSLLNIFYLQNVYLDVKSSKPRSKHLRNEYAVGEERLIANRHSGFQYLANKFACHCSHKWSRLTSVTAGHPSPSQLPVQCSTGTVPVYLYLACSFLHSARNYLLQKNSLLFSWLELSTKI